MWLLCLWIIVPGTILPFALSLAALRHLPATRVSIVAMVEVVLGAFVAWVWLGETLDRGQLLGGGSSSSASSSPRRPADAPAYPCGR